MMLSTLVLSCLVYEDETRSASPCQFSCGWVLMLMAALIYTAIAVSPLVVLRLGIRSGKTLADAQKWRRQNKTFFRILSGVGFLTLAVFLVAFEVMGR